MKSIKRDVREMFSILPFEVPFYQDKHKYPIHYVGNPTVQEVAEFKETTAKAMRTSVPGTDWNPTGRLLRSWQAAGSKR